MSLMGLKLRFQQDYVHSGGLWRKSVPCLLPLPEAAPFLGSWDCVTLTSAAIALPPRTVPPPFPSKGLRDYIAPQDNLRSSLYLNTLNAVMSIKSPLPCKVAYSQVWGLGHGRFQAAISLPTKPGR